MFKDGKLQWDSLGEIDTETEKEINDLIAAVEKKARIGRRASGVFLEERYEALKEAVGAGICILKDGNIKETNRAFDSMLGFAVRGLIGCNLMTFIDDADMQKLVSNMRKGNEDPCEVEFFREDGSSFIALAELSEIKFDGGPAMSLTVHQVAPYIEENKALKEEAAFLEDTFNKIPDAFYIADLDGRLMRWNSALRSMLGYSDDELADMSLVDLVAEEDLPIVEEEIIETYENGFGRMIEVTAISKGGKRTPYEFIGGLLTDDQGNPISVYGLGRDITERKLAMMALELQRDLALGIIEADSLKEVFQCCLDAVLTAAGVDSGGIYLYEPDGGTFKTVNCIGCTKSNASALEYLVDNSIEAELVKKKKFVYHVRELVTVSETGTETDEGLRCLAMVPVTHNGVLKGCICVTSSTKEIIPERTKPIIAGLAKQIGSHVKWALEHFGQ